MSSPEIDPSRPLEPAAATWEAADKLRRTISSTMRQFRRLRADHGVSGAKLSVLGHLYRAGVPLTATDLARRERLQPQSLTRIIADLDQQKLIERCPDPDDRRNILIRITEAGTELLARDAFRQTQWLAESMTAQLTQAERDILVVATALLNRLSAS